MSATPKNNGTLIGRLAADPRVFDNADGSKKVSFTVFVDRDYIAGDGSRPSDAIPVEAFISNRAQGIGPYGAIHKGDQIAVSTSLRFDHYTTKNGVEVREVKVVSESIAFLEPRSVTQARQARAAGVEVNPAAMPVEQAPVETAAPVMAESLPFG